MKKIIIIAALVLCIAVSIVSGTLATYTKTLEPIWGEVAAKQFYIGTTQTMFPNIELAPTEEATWAFGVVNFQGDTSTEVDMDMDIILTVGSPENNQPIDGLVVGLYENGKQLGTSIVRAGEMKYSIEKAFLASIKSTRIFEIKVLWDNGISSDEIDTINTELRNKSKIAVTVTGTQCLHNGGGESPEDQIKTSAQKLADGSYEMTFENNGQSMENGWLMEFSSEAKEILSNADSISVSKGSDTQWNTVQLIKAQNGKWQVIPKLGYQHNAVSLLKGDKLILRFNSTAAVQDFNISAAELKVPYDINGISVGFRYDGYNMFIDLNNKSGNSRIYGWELEFKTDIQLSKNSSSTWDINETNFDGQMYTYVIKTKANTNDGRIFFSPKEKKEIFNTPAINHISMPIIRDVKFFNQNVDSTIN